MRFRDRISAALGGSRPVRQRLNHSLKLLEDAGLLRVGYGGIRVLNVAGLFQFEAAV